MNKLIQLPNGAAVAPETVTAVVPEDRFVSPYDGEVSPAQVRIECGPRSLIIVDCASDEERDALAARVIAEVNAARS